jgi:maltooligosyltrehalose trehalohydrolase
MARRLPIGAEVGQGGVHFRVWAPEHRRVTLAIEGEELELEMQGGHCSRFVPGLAAGTRYRFRIGDALVADPASRFQPEGPFGPSEVVDPTTFRWTDDAWRGIEPHRHVFYELHPGTFTPEGTWAAAGEHLGFLAELGVTTIELMPVAEFAGTRNWGYDGVFLYAPTRNYGTPDDLRRFVDRAHASGLAVILDVVYNHIGPDGSTLLALSPHYRSNAVTDWGDGYDFARREVRDFIAGNAAHWIAEYHLDGLRLDAIQSIADDSPEHIVAELARRAREAAGERRLVIVGEDEPQDVRFLRDCGVDALWNDDFHHAARVAATGLVEGYLHDYRGTAQEFVSAALRGFLYQGQLYPWQRNPRGTRTRGLSRRRFVHFLENHDQAANIGFGERLVTLTDPATFRALTALLLLAPELPLLFQGQETGSRARWQFFVEHRPELAAAVKTGRAEFVTQFARLATPEAQAALPDPGAPSTFASCVLEPRERTFDRPIAILHRDLLALRRGDPVLSAPAPELDGAVLSDRAFALRFAAGDAERLLLVNLGPTFVGVSVPEPLLAPPAGTGWKLVWSSEHPRYGGHGTPPPFTRVRLAIPAHAAILLEPDPAASLRVDPPPADKPYVEP